MGLNPGHTELGVFSRPTSVSVIIKPNIFFCHCERFITSCRYICLSSDSVDIESPYIKYDLLKANSASPWSITECTLSLRFVSDKHFYIRFTQPYNVHFRERWQTHSTFHFALEQFFHLIVFYENSFSELLLNCISTWCKISCHNIQIESV